MGLHVS